MITPLTSLPTISTLDMSNYVWFTICGQEGNILVDTNINYSLLHPGATIAYRLPSSEQPRNPNRLWKGRVIRMYGGTLLTVEIMEFGYHGLTEFVRIDQIAAVSGE